MIKINYSSKYKKQFKVALVLFILLVSLIMSFFISSFFVFSLSNRFMDIISPNLIFQSIVSDKKHLMLFLLISILCSTGFSYVCLWKRNIGSSTVDTVKLTPAIEVPKAVGQNQYGSARFTTPAEQNKHFTNQFIDINEPLIAELLKRGKADAKAILTGEVVNVEPLDKSLVEKYIAKGGIPIAYEQLNNGREKILLVFGDAHTVCYGATRCGKTRTLVVQSLCIQGLSGDDMLNIDPKGELFEYTHPFLTRLGYIIFTLDFKEPNKSFHFNFLQFVIDALNGGDISKGIQCCWDFVDCLVQEGRQSEPIWTNGEKALITAAVMQVVYDNSPLGLPSQYPSADEKKIAELYETKHKWFQNCTNLYNYLSQMSQLNKKTQKLLLEDIIEVLPDNHPSKLIMRVAESAPNRMRGSFVTSALTTLRLFTDPNISEMTSYTDSVFMDTKSKKAIFIIVPDAKKTYYPLVSLFIDQYYQFLSETADKRGGRLIRKIHINAEEFGNCTAFPSFDTKLTVGAGRGILFNLYLQSRDQLVEKYGKDLAGIILDNCHYTVYLKSGMVTAQMIEEKLGKYTVLSTSSSASLNDSGGLSTVLNGGSTSSSTQLIGRPLLTAEEIAKIQRPYLLVLADDGFPSLTQSPDLSKWLFNTMLGLGDEEHNRQVREFRNSLRPTHEISPLRLWDFVTYINNLLTAKEDEVTSEDDFMDAIAKNFSNSFS